MTDSRSDDHRTSEELSALWTERDVLAEAEAIRHIGSWLLDIRNNRAWWSDETYRIFGHQPQEFPASYEKFMEQVHPEDRESMQVQMRTLFDGGSVYDLEHRVRRADGGVRHVREHGRLVRDDSGRPLLILGTVWDITAEVWMQRQRDEASGRWPTARNGIDSWRTMPGMLSGPWLSMDPLRTSARQLNGCAD